MTDPLTFADSSPRWSLPLLFAGQAQKEVFVNEALARLDALLHAVVEGEATTPPASPAEGETWIVGPGGSGAWEGQDDSLACRQEGQWLFLAPSEGMLAYDRVTGQRRLFRAGWSVAPTVPAVIGGTTADTEARAAIGVIVAALSHYGLISES